MIFQSIPVTIMLLLATVINSEILSKTDCLTRCGNLNIPFPFGTTSDCYLDDAFLITCNHSYNPPKPFLNSGNIEVLEISLDGLMKVSSSVASDCYDDSGAQTNGTISELVSSRFLISSTQNKFTAVGCDTYALVKGSREWKQMSAGCVSWCDSINSVTNGTCRGIGCCQTSVPKGVKDFLVDIRSFRNHMMVKSFNPCGYAFVVEAEAFEFSSLDLNDLRNRKTVPVVLDWSVGNVTCQEARENLSSYACRAIHSECSDSIYGFGYHCNCLTGFQGNPYLVNGCQDINENTSLKPCQGTCANLLGTHSCSCPKGFEGDCKNDGSGCHPKSPKTNAPALFYVASGLMVPVVGSCWLFQRRKQKKLAKLRQNLFMANGGLILENMLSGQRTLQVFNAEDLKNATDNYNENRVIHRDEYRQITYKGILPNADTQQVTIHKCYELEGCKSQRELFVIFHKLVNLSRINHKNVVKLIGCCLETQVPLLVYESTNTKSLYDYIHDDYNRRSLSWDILMKIAAETAGALAYMHSAALQVPFIHGNLNSYSITLNHDYTVKLHDFGLTNKMSGFELRRMFGYLDPEYFGSGQLTEKSDVYSFGVVLAEILTGKKVTGFERTEGQDLSMFLVSLPGEYDLLCILDHRLVAEGKIEQLTQVANLAQRCLSSSSADRPTMKEIVIALEYVISIKDG